MQNTRRKFTPAFKTKVALEAIKEDKSLAEIARRNRVHINQISKWKREFLEKAVSVFERSETRSEGAEREEELLKKIGELIVERDFLSRGLGRLG